MTSTATAFISASDQVTSRNVDPPDEREERKHQDDWNEVPANLVRQLLDRRLTGLCFLDEAHDLRKNRVPARPSSPVA